MQPTLGLEVYGEVELEQALQEIIEDGGKKAVNQALRKACKEAVTDIVKPEVMARVPVDFGFLESQLKVRAIKRSRNRVGYSIGFPDPLFQGDTFYGGFIEFGWDHYKGVKVEADSYLRSSLYPNAEAIISRVRARMTEWANATNR